jgi:hypothetical protein
LAGKYHHHVWQMLQRGFSWKENNDNQIWVYRRAKEPEQTVTRLFGGAKYFYGPKGSIADSNITKFEGNAQSYIQDVRLLPDGTVLDATVVCPIISHLEMRSLFLRDEMSRLADRIVVAVREHFSSTAKMKVLIANFLREKPDQFIEFFQKNGVPPEFNSALLDLVDVRLPGLVDEVASDLMPALRGNFQVLQDMIAESVIQAHVKSLEGDFAEVQRTQLYSQLRYQVLHLSSDGLILPDTSLAFFKESGLAPVTQKSDKVESVVLPISSKVAIVGYSGRRFDKSLQTIQRALASCSYEAFIAQSRDENLFKLAARISKNARLISDADLQRTLRFESLI